MYTPEEKQRRSNGVELNFALSLADLRKRKPGELALTGPKTSN
jgi:hypothetical protein